MTFLPHAYRIVAALATGLLTLACDSEPICEPVPPTEQNFGDGCVVDVPYDLERVIVCADLADADGVCPALGASSVDAFEDELFAANTPGNEWEAFHGIVCGPIPAAKNPPPHQAECCYYGLTGERLQTNCPPDYE